MMHTAHPEIVLAPVYEPILEYIPMVMYSEEEDPCEEEDPSEGTYDPIIDWDIDLNSSFYYSDSSAPSNKGSQISSRGRRRARGCGRGCHF